MYILALESTGPHASVALTDENGNIEEIVNPGRLNHLETMIPMVDQLIKKCGLRLSDVTAVAASRGPGSFTGIRIGVTTARTLAQALGIETIGVPTLNAFCYNQRDFDGLICPVFDARRNQVYTGIYEFRGNPMEVLEPQMAVDIEVIAEKLCERQQDVIFLGDGVPVFKDKLCNGLMDKLHDCGKEFYFAPAHVNKQRAGAVGALALRYLEEGKTETAEEHQPEYLRMAQAERERAEKLAKGEGTC